jgi:predicted N-acetyltransferase YhbS
MSSPSLPATARIRRATPQDAEVCGRIIYEAFATINRSHSFPPELPGPEAAIGMANMLFSNPEFYSVVAESQGRIIGSNTLDERGIIAGLGPVAVDPKSQNRGIGRMLMLAMQDRARERGMAGVRLLQSAFHSRSLSLYSKLGFITREPVSVMQGLPPHGPIEGLRVRHATVSDLEACNRLSERVHGHNRSGELRDGIRQQAALVVERHGGITGYASGFGYFGHAVGEANVDIKALLCSVEEVGGPGVLVPNRNAELFRWCLSNGMRIFQPMTLMSTGLYSEPAGAWLPSILY